MPTNIKDSPSTLSSALLLEDEAARPAATTVHVTHMLVCDAVHLLCNNMFFVAAPTTGRTHRQLVGAMSYTRLLQRDAAASLRLVRFLAV